MEDDNSGHREKSELFTIVATHQQQAHDDTEDGFWQRRARHMARNPWRHFWIALVGTLVLSVIGFTFGDFSTESDNAGWQSRGTLIADRQTQALLILLNDEELFYNGEPVWEDLTNNIQPRWERGTNDDFRRQRRQRRRRRRRRRLVSNTAAASIEKELPFSLSEPLQRRLQTSIEVQGCDATWYTSTALLDDIALWPVWKASSSDISTMDPRVVQDVCVAEQNTIGVLEKNGLCRGCKDGDSVDDNTRCLPAYSLVLLARLVVNDVNFTLSCTELADAWTAQVPNVTAQLQECVTQVVAQGDFDTIPTSCPFLFTPALVDEFFSNNNNPIITYTSSIFRTKQDSGKALYDVAPQYDRALDSRVVEGAYDTQDEDFINRFVLGVVSQDMTLAMGSAIITTIAIVVHTKSCWLTIVGLMQIILSFPLAYFVYTFVGRIEFFPFLNFLGVFVVFALGADDVFVAVDKWKNARIANPSGSIEDIAAVALPDAAGAMFLTTLTTAVAFFATAISPVAPLKCFAVFLGLLIVFDYFLCCLLIFPALCLYDKWKGGGCCFNLCVTCGSRRKKGTEVDEASGELAAEDEATKLSLIHRILLMYYKFLHWGRWPLLAVCIAGFVVSAVVAITMELPSSSDVRVVSSDKIQYERNYEWRQKILHHVLEKNSGSEAVVIWGVVPADTGRKTNPDSWSQLVLDDTFDPSTQEAQSYLLGFCDEFFAQEFASESSATYECPINEFDSWLKVQSNSTRPSMDYQNKCANATGLPMDSAAFHSCFVGWSYLTNTLTVLSRNNEVEIVYVRFTSRARFDSPFDELSREWNLLEDFLSNQRENVAPSSCNGMYHSSFDFWWFDTNGSMLRAALSAAGIALGAAGGVVLFASRSVVLTLFSIFTIGYVLASTTAMLVGIGWTLGFLESVCFAILIGISCDFVIHFGHAYTTLEGDVDRYTRTKFALLSMGPSILAAAFTTICAATIMMFTVIIFFQKFAIILFFTVLQATVGSFVVYLTLAETFGPSQPTYTVDWIVSKIRGKHPDGEQETDADQPKNMDETGAGDESGGDSDNLKEKEEVDA